MPSERPNRVYGLYSGPMYIGRDADTYMNYLEELISDLGHYLDYLPKNEDTQILASKLHALRKTAKQGYSGITSDQQRTQEAASRG